jgi:cysteine-S-conjugate beta-lyase
LIMPFEPERTAVKWPYSGPCVRIHAGLEHVQDLLQDLEEGFKRLNAQ